MFPRVIAITISFRKVWCFCQTHLLFVPTFFHSCIPHISHLHLSHNCCCSPISSRSSSRQRVSIRYLVTCTHHIAVFQSYETQDFRDTGVRNYSTYTYKEFNIHRAVDKVQARFLDSAKSNYDKNPHKRTYVWGFQADLVLICRVFQAKSVSKLCLQTKYFIGYRQMKSMSKHNILIN